MISTNLTGLLINLVLEGILTVIVCCKILMNEKKFKGGSYMKDQRTDHSDKFYETIMINRKEGISKIPYIKMVNKIDKILKRAITKKWSAQDVRRFIDVSILDLCKLADARLTGCEDTGDYEVVSDIIIYGREVLGGGNYVEDCREE